MPSKTVRRSIHRSERIVLAKLKTAPKLNLTHKQKRIQFACDNMEMFWNNAGYVIFSWFKVRFLIASFRSYLAMEKKIVFPAPTVLILISMIFAKSHATFRNVISVVGPRWFGRLLQALASFSLLFHRREWTALSTIKSSARSFFHFWRSLIVYHWFIDKKTPPFTLELLPKLGLQKKSWSNGFPCSLFRLQSSRKHLELPRPSFVRW